MIDEAQELRRAFALTHVIRRTERRIESLRKLLPDLLAERNRLNAERDGKLKEQESALVEQKKFVVLVDDMQCGRSRFDYERFETCRSCAQQAAANAEAAAGEAEGLRREALRVSGRIDEVRAEIAANTARIELCKERHALILTQIAAARDEAADEEVGETAALSYGRKRLPVEDRPSRRLEVRSKRPRDV